MNMPLAGSLQVLTGLPVPNIVRQRPQGLSRLWRGQPAQALPALLGAVFTLCGHAHRLAARQAVAAARGQASRLSADELKQLHWHTAREQARRVTLDWAALARQAEAPALQALRASPLLGHEPKVHALNDWLQHEVLMMPATPWLERLQAHGEVWLGEWCEATTTSTARALRAGRVALQGVRVTAASLNLHDDEAAQQRLAHHLGSAPADAFVQAPHTARGCADTGAWSRAADPRRGSHHNAWMRMASRLVDLVRLSAHCADATWLSAGARNTGPNEGLAWIETARGLLVHWVRLDGARVADCQVLSPTDWNFHPRGGLAQALAATHSAETAEWLVAAFDPCVAHRVVLQREPVHA